MRTAGPRGPASGQATAGWTALLVAGCVATALQLRDPSPAQPQRDPHGHDNEASRPQRLYAWDERDAAALRLRSPQGERRWRVAPNGAWAVAEASPPDDNTTDPPARPAGAFDPAAMLALLSQARVDRALDTVATAEHGLVPPQLHLEVDAADGRPLARLAVGARTPDGYGRYVQVPGREAVLVVPHYQFAAALAVMEAPHERAPAPGPGAAASAAAQPVDYTVRPPSTGNSTPVMNSASSLAR